MNLDSISPPSANSDFARGPIREGRKVPRRSRIRHSAVIGTFLLAFFLASGCAASSNGGHADAETPSTVVTNTFEALTDEGPELTPTGSAMPGESSAAAVIAPTSPLVVSSRDDNTLYVAAPIGCDAADPAYDHTLDTRAANSFTIVPEIHVGLFSLSPDGSEVKLELAESHAVNDDFSSYEFLLRDGLKFSDGSALTAADVKWSWERALRVSEGNGRAGDVFGSIVGAGSVTVAGGEIEGIEVVDDSKLKVRLSVPRA